MGIYMGVAQPYYKCTNVDLLRLIVGVARHSIDTFAGQIYISHLYILFT